MFLNEKGNILFRRRTNLDNHSIKANRRPLEGSWQSSHLRSRTSESHFMIKFKFKFAILLYPRLSSFIFFFFILIKIIMRNMESILYFNKRTDATTLITYLVVSLRTTTKNWRIDSVSYLWIMYCHPDLVAHTTCKHSLCTIMLNYVFQNVNSLYLHTSVFCKRSVLYIYRVYTLLDCSSQFELSWSPDKPER